MLENLAGRSRPPPRGSLIPKMARWPIAMVALFWVIAMRVPVVSADGGGFVDAIPGRTGTILATYDTASPVVADAFVMVMFYLIHFREFGGKTLSGVVRDGATFVRFPILKKTLSSPELARALTKIIQETGSHVTLEIVNNIVSDILVQLLAEPEGLAATGNIEAHDGLLVTTPETWPRVRADLPRFFGQEAGSHVSVGPKNRRQPTPASPGHQTTACSPKDHPPFLPYDDQGHCPFECCYYGNWRVEKGTQLYEEQNQHSRVMATLRQGERVRALTGVVRTLEVAVVSVGQGLDASCTKIGIQPGDCVTILNYRGEGFWKVWMDGRVVGDCEIHKFIQLPPRTEWWVRIRNASSTEGWAIEDGDHFSGNDRCEEGLAAPRLAAGQHEATVSRERSAG